MLRIKDIRENKDEIIFRLNKRGKDFTPQIEQLLIFDNQKKGLLLQIEKLRAERNKGNFTKNDKGLLRNFEDVLDEIEQDIYNILIEIPNVPCKETKDENEIIYENDVVINLPENYLCHWDLAAKYNIINFELGAKITGNGFPLYIGKGAKLQRAIINFCLDNATENGFVEHEVPILVKQEAVFATGQYPDKEDNMYRTEDNLYLIPTGEVPLTNIYRDTIVNENDLPIKMVTYTPCFRKETGHYGKNIKALNRVHQFDKIELVCLTKQEEGYNMFYKMKDYVENLLKLLNIKYRILEIGGKDLGFTYAKGYDIEGYCAAQDKWLELVTIGEFETFQANRLNCRYKTNGETKLVHTLNGTALALPRLVATILENNQTEDGILIPEALVKYTGFEKI